MEKGNGFGNDFIRSLLLTLEQTDHKQFMDLSYHVLMQSPSSVLKRTDAIENKIKSIDGLIKYFESIEEYEKCTNLQKLKAMLYLNTPFDDNDIQKPD
jgi:hypothetical protein|tara:strand:+ start:2799 stop:3092 length:294 start_codon:yes stop_codon:yes gene_type:complete